MKSAFGVVLYGLGALALLVVVNWARKDLFVGLVAAALILAAVGVASLRSGAEEDEPAGSTSSSRQ